MLLDNQTLTAVKIRKLLPPIPDNPKSYITRAHISNILTIMQQQGSLKRNNRGSYIKGLKDDEDIVRWEKQNVPKTMNQDSVNGNSTFSYLGVVELRDRIIRRNYNNSIYATCSVERLGNLYVSRGYDWDTELALIEMGFKLHDGSVVKGEEAFRWFAFTNNF